MKAQLHQLYTNRNTSFLYEKWDYEPFDKPWHFHKEYELVLIENSTGNKFVGDKVMNFKDGDLTLIGSNVPHLFRKYDDDENLIQASSIFIHFTEELLGSRFSEIPEFQSIHNLLEKSALVLNIHGKTRTNIIRKLYEMSEESPQKRLLSLLEILIDLSQSREIETLLSLQYTANNSGDTDKINSVFEFILKNFKRGIYIEEVASKLNMSVASFSRYFKNHTRKTFSQYVTEVRIGHACRLLMEDNYNITQICYSSGFENLSNFYRHFKKITGTIPKNYRNRFLEKNSVSI
ncbi:MAG: AraC family transcriptional regulator [Bacteroidota bacterium]